VEVTVASRGQDMNELQKMVHGWLDAEGYQTTDVSSANAEWLLQLTMPNGWKHFVVQPKGHQEALEIVSTFTFSPEELRFLASLSARRAREFLWELRMRLVFVQTEFALLAPKDGFHEGLQFVRHLSYDGLTRNQFLEGLREVHKCEMFVGWMVTRERELAAPP
jgi:hypothetical protein